MVFPVLPTLLTLGNGVCGFGAITLATRWTKYEPPSALFAAGCLIFLAMLFDGLDGAAARWTNQTSKFGAQLDSLCDAISFGAAPAILVLELARPLGYHPRVLWVAAAVYMVCALLRLARFNTADDDHDSGGFRGLPSPGAAAVVASFPIMLFGPQLFLDADPAAGISDIDLGVTLALPVVAVGIACLMVSRVRYPHAFHRVIRGRRSRRYLIRLVFGVAIVVAVPRLAVPILAGWYAFAPPAVASWHRYRQGWSRRSLPPPDGRRPQVAERDGSDPAESAGP